MTSTNNFFFEPEQIQAATECLREAVTLIGRGVVEDVIRHNFTSHIYRMFPDRPRWAKLHIEGGETRVRFARGGKAHGGFVDNLVDSTAIEYEANLSSRAKFSCGYGQVKEYCAALLNEGRTPDIIIGVLSDTVHWRAYRITSILKPPSGPMGGENIELEEIDHIDGSAASEADAKHILEFLVRYLGRLGARPLSASSISRDLGFDSIFCLEHIEQLRELVERAFETNPSYGALVETLWRRFVSFVGAPDRAGAFERTSYADELYLLTLAKLVCANALEKRTLYGNHVQVESILKGDYFKSKGFNNLVEYDYFGWLHQSPFLDDIVAVADEIQDDLRAYDFGSTPAEDLFGQLMAQLAKRAQRLLLGQAWTPRWLARALVSRVISSLPKNEEPRLVDMCCGSGAMIVEAVLAAKELISSSIPEKDHDVRVRELALTITGFDIDPLAVILAKISWVLAARDWLEPLGTFSISIPIYHADSLFAITPLSSTLGLEETQEFHRLHIAGTSLELPRFLISPGFQGAFDAIIDRCYELAMSGGDKPILVNDSVLETATRSALSSAIEEPNTDQIGSAKTFLKSFTETVDQLNREGRNGIWAFILRNSYRPGVVAGQFNGLVSNPPWLALSRIADNPYRDALRKKAEQFGIKPPGPSFLHIEMSTIFLLHAVDRYLRPGAKVGCIVPDSVLTGYNHNPFRNAAYSVADKPVDFNVEEVWRMPETTFKNRGAALIGSKSPAAIQSSVLVGFRVDESGETPVRIHLNVQGNRTAWSEHAMPAGTVGFFDPASFRQGADIMPRSLFFHELTAVPADQGRAQWYVKPIDPQISPLAFAIKDAKKQKDFRLMPCVLPDDLFFDVLTSNLLTPFHLAIPLRALLPIRKGENELWEPLGDMELIAMGSSVASAFRQICSATGGPSGTVANIWTLINTRGKLVQQQIGPSGHIVLTGTSGEIVCSAFCNADSLRAGRLIIDQTLNWACVETFEEALYLTGLLNSEAINDVIRDFQPEGAFGRRHIHSLPFRATPPFDPMQALHQDVVTQTRLLIDQYSDAMASDSTLRARLDPNVGTLAQRRLAVNRILKKLPVYADYAGVCRNLYGVS